MNLRAAVQAIVPASMRARLLRSGPIRMDRAQWDREYAGGYGRAMGSLVEFPRYSVIAGYCGLLGSKNVLDIGCGAGVLRHHLGMQGSAGYLGVDLSPTAIEQARGGEPGDARFEVADAETYQPQGRFDAIVFNEMLYYLERPEALLGRCAGCLADDGAFIVSLFETGLSWRTWRRCVGHLTVLDEVTVQRSRTVIWRVRMCRPR